ncbi:Thivi_2564 family membrane protein [Maribellus maritimus]|uniref:Thivi_2564 family membrane protein n=1 Tax=Maribellus maritimus TaxID=2870838 RepID=UPI00374D9640
MPVLTFVIVLLVVLVILWQINSYVPAQRSIKYIIIAIVAVVLIIWLLYVFGIFDS